jgi:pimeloyl-ACP methyl ester carboxylesterase
MSSKTLASNIEIYYQRSGSGPSLVLIMGTGLDHSCWNNQVEAYREEFDCICFDNRGTGKTTATDGPITTELMARDTAELMDALGVCRAHVAGLSLGSCVAQELALMRPDLVRTLQLHGTWGRAHGYAARKFEAQIRLLQAMNVRSFYEINVLWFMTPQFMQRHPDLLSDQIDAAVRSNPSAAALIRQYQADLDHDCLERLDQIHSPTLVTVGSFDLAAPPLYAHEVADRIPGAELVVFEGGGHLHNIENPQEFNEVTLEFLRRHS